MHKSEFINITLALSCHQKAPTINYLNVVGTKKKAKTSEQEIRRKLRLSNQHGHKNKKESGKHERMLEVYRVS